jgi:PKD domain/PA14 domain
MTAGTVRTTMRWGRLLVPLLLFGMLAGPGWAMQRHSPGTVALPEEIASSRFALRVNGQEVAVAHAAANYYFANFDVRGAVTVTVTAPTEDYWARGVEVQPWRLGIRPRLKGRTISFRLDGPAKISITRPGDFLGGAEMLFLFANRPERDAPRADTAGVRYYGPGVHRGGIDAKSGDVIYLAPGAVVLGGLNLWHVENVRVFGRGVIVYDGPQDPYDDTGWIHKPDWHAIVMDEARHVSIEGITCVVRSRTWMIQMKDSRDIRFDNVKVIGGSEGNANQDGMDWLGGGDTVVRDSFFRAADDVFAMQGNWDGYSPEAMAIPGHEVSNITIEDSVVSTSISNIVRAAWPNKSFDSRHFVMRNVDVLHMGMGACVVPFALLEIWADPDGHGTHADYVFDDVRLEDWYSLVQLRQPTQGIENVRFRDVTALESGSLVPSTLKGSVKGVSFDSVTLANRLVEKKDDVPLEVVGGASEPLFSSTAARAGFTYSAGLIAPRHLVRFAAGRSQAGAAKIVRYEWSFGDGTRATGRVVQHAFPDAEGTLWDHSGKFRVLLRTMDENGRSSWAYAPVVVARRLQPAMSSASTQAGVRYEYFGEPRLDVDELRTEDGIVSGVSQDIRVAPPLHEDYGAVFKGLVEVPADGGYTFTLLGDDGGRLEVDSVVIAASPKTWPQVCGSEGNAVQAARGSVALAKGRHRIRVAMTHTAGADGFAVLWEGPGVQQEAIPASALSHEAQSDEEKSAPVQ